MKTGGKLLLIVNPRAGRAAVKGHLLNIVDSFVRAGYALSVYTTGAPLDAYNYAKAHGGEYDRVVCSGGDGTVNEVLNGLMELENRPEFGIIPAGTMNDYAYNLNIPSDMSRAAVIAAGNKKFTIDVGRFNGRYFTYVAAFGLFTEVTYETPQDTKNLFGVAAYILEGAKRVGNIKTIHASVEFDTGATEGDYILGLFANSISVAGMRNAFNGSHLDDGLLEIALVRAPRTPAELSGIVNILLDIEHFTNTQSDAVTFVRTRSVTVTCDEETAWTVDGESGGRCKRAVIDNVPGGITVLRGAHKQP